MINGWRSEFLPGDSLVSFPYAEHLALDHRHQTISRVRFLVGCGITLEQVTGQCITRAYLLTVRKRLTAATACARSASQSSGGLPRSSMRVKTRYASSRLP